MSTSVPSSPIPVPSSAGALAPEIGYLPTRLAADYSIATTEQSRLNVVVVGHVDHGKSTLIGRLLFDTGSLMKGKIEQVRKACAAENMEFEYAFLLDALLEEQEQNITIDTTRIPFHTAKREYAIIDAPGHTEFLKNMVTGAASASAAFLLIDAQEGIKEQSKRHAEQFELFNKKIGRLELQAYNTMAAGGREWRVGKLQLSNPDGALSGNGKWVIKDGQSTTSLRFGLDIVDVPKPAPGVPIMPPVPVKQD